MKRRFSAPICLFLSVGIVCLVQAETDEWNPLTNRLVKDGLAVKEVRSLFELPDVAYDPEPMRTKMQTLFEAKFHAGRIREIQRGLAELGFNPGPIDGMDGPRTRKSIAAFQKKFGYKRVGKPSEAALTQIRETQNPELRKKRSDSPPVYKSIIQPERLAEAKEFYQQELDLLNRIDREFRIPPEITVGILTVETRVGKFLGSRPAVTTLASMALCSDFNRVLPFFDEQDLTRERLDWLKARSKKTAGWAYVELKALLEYTRENKLDLVGMPGSVYGAIGISQFMPSNAVRFGVDGNGDGVVDLFNLEDALFSMGSYMKATGWKGTNRRRARKVLFRYNRSRTYVNTVMAVADHLSEPPASQAGR